MSTAPKNSCDVIELGQLIATPQYRSQIEPVLLRGGPPVVGGGFDAGAGGRPAAARHEVPGFDLEARAGTDAYRRSNDEPNGPRNRGATDLLCCFEAQQMEF
jgi:hypothetical protein